MSTREQTNCTEEGRGEVNLPFDRDYVWGYLSEVLAETVGDTKDPHIRALMEWLRATPESFPKGREGEDKWAMLVHTGHLSQEVADAARATAAGVGIPQGGNDAGS